MTHAPIQIGQQRRWSQAITVRVVGFLITHEVVVVEDVETGRRNVFPARAVLAMPVVV